uniref:phosphatidylinositol 3,4,5-trisphosphate 5-phosphatase 2-like n=1 Tax=Myxine glutinosa TaxID=7769 RepID=UPI00358E0386
MVFKVDVEGGKMAILKRPKDTPEESNVFSHKRILQLIKSQRTPSKLGIVFDKDKERNQRRDFVFETPRKREAFCQLMQQMKNRHSEQGEPDLISIFIGTWNMGSSPSPRQIQSWLTSKGLGRTRDETTMSVPHDVYVLGSQENSLGEREWAEQVRCSLREITGLDFRTVASPGLWNMKLLVLVKSEHENRISHVNTSCVKTGLANTLGNKGAVGASFVFGGTSLGFVNSHLTSGNEKTSRRNQNYLDILRFLSLGDKRLNSFDITSRFTHLFWFGDLNYRLDMDVQEIIAHVSKKEFEPLLKVDQLNLEREKNKMKRRLRFLPRTGMRRGTRDSYAWQKFKTTGVRVNVPSWCDRILWKSYPETHLICSSYGCTDDIVTSDHSPVFATFEVGVTSQFVSKKVSVEESYIKFESVEAIVKTNSRTKFFLEFYSSCLEGSCKSVENDTQQSEVVNFLKLGWSDLQLPTLKPLISDLEYLQDQHLLLSIKSMDGYESYGECCIALKSMIGSTSQQFETFLSHRGEETGNVRGWMKVQVPMDRLATRERLYDWISIDTEDNVISKGKQPAKIQETGIREPQPSFIAGARPTGLPPSIPCTDAVAGIKAREKERDSEWDKEKDGERRRDLSEKPSISAVVQTSSEDPHVYDEPVTPRTKTPNGEGAPSKNCFDNPSYFIIEGFPAPTAGSMAAIPECPSSPALGTGGKGSVRATADGPPISPHPTVPQQHYHFFGSKSRPGHAMARVVGGENDNHPQYLCDDSISQEDCLSPNRPPPDYPPPPLPSVGRLWPGDGKSRPVVLYDHVAEDGALEEQGIGFNVLGKCTEKERKNADVSWKDEEAEVESKQVKEQGGSNGSESDTQCVLGLVTDRLLSGPGVEPRHKYQAATRLSVPPAEDHSWFALQMAKSLCDGEYSFVGSDLSVETSTASCHPPLPAKGRASVLEEKCFGLRAGSSVSASSHSERQARVRQCGTAHVRRWLSTLGLETYTTMLVENGWDDLEYLGDLTKDDLNEIGVLEPSHQRLLLDNLPNIAE